MAHGFSRVGEWMKDTVSALANEIGAALLEDIPEFRQQLDRDVDIKREFPNGCHSDSPKSDAWLEEESTNLEDPADWDEFFHSQYTDNDVMSLRRMLPSLDTIPIASPVWKRLVYESHMRGHSTIESSSEEYDAVEDAIVVNPARQLSGSPVRTQTVLILDERTDELTEWS
jgi:hypothetical protein